MSDLVEFRHLKYILAVAETGNFTRAAERLFIAQPSLSKQIKDLEDEIGFPIFIRNRDGLRITPAGRMIIAYAQEALSARSEIISIAHAIHNGQLTPLRLGFSPFVDPRLLEFLRDGYQDLFPGCPICPMGGSFLHILQRLEQGSLDGALLPMPIEGPEWVVRQVACEPLAVCMRIGDPLAHERAVSTTDLAAHLRVFRDPELHPAAHERLMQMLLEVGINPAPACWAANPTDIQWMVRSGFGLALVDKNAHLDPDLTTRPIAGIAWTADTAFVHHRTATHLALPSLLHFLDQKGTNPTRRRAIAKAQESAVQLNLLA